MKLKTGALLVALLCTFVSAAGGCGDKINYPDGKPEFTTEREFFIGGFASPDPSDEAYKWVAESGINNMVTYATPTIELGSPAFYKDPFDYGGKYGVNIIPNTSNQPWTVFNPPTHLSNWVKRDNFNGVNVFDEPDADDFDALYENLVKWQEKYLDYSYYINLFPIYATPEQLAAENYEEYVRLFTEKLLSKMSEGHRYMICDIYPLLKQSQILGTWLKNLEILKEYADTAQAEMYIYIQSIGFSNRRQPASAADLKFQSYVSMAYGATGIYHFTYQTPYWDDMYTYSHSLVDHNGEKTEVYDYAKENNFELLAFDDVYLDFEWKAAVSAIGSANLTGQNENFSTCENMAADYGVLRGVEAEQDTLVGCFENQDGYQGFMVVNFTDPTLKKTDNVTLTLGGDVTNALVYVKGQESVADVADGKLQLNLAPGEGVFVVPYKG